MASTLSPEPDGSGNMYSVTVTLCNFLGSCGVATHSWSVLTRSKPRLWCRASLRSVTRSDRWTICECLDLCLHGLDSSTSSDLTYTWAVVDMDDGSKRRLVAAANTRVCLSLSRSVLSRHRAVLELEVSLQPVRHEQLPQCVCGGRGG